VCIGTNLVGGELDYGAPAAARLVDGPLEDCRLA